MHASICRLRKVNVYIHDTYPGLWQSALNHTYKQDAASFSQKKKSPCQLKDRRKQRKILKTPELQTAPEETLDGSSLPVSWKLGAKSRGIYPLSWKTKAERLYLWTFISLPHLLSSAHTGTTVHHEGRTAILIMLSKAKLASVCVPWVSSKEQLAPVCNGRC